MSLAFNFPYHPTQPTNVSDERKTFLFPFYNKNFIISDQSPPSEISGPSFPYGDDWSDRAHFASHCWLPYLSNNSSTSQLCAYVSCTNSKSNASSLVQCASCSLIMHADHLIDLQATPNAHNPIPLCRPSFKDSDTVDDISLYDRHHWRHVPILSQRCEHCKRKSLSSTSYNGDHRTSSGLVCLWCSRAYHRRCWENMGDDAEKSNCDYGVYG